MLSALDFTIITTAVPDIVNTHLHVRRWICLSGECVYAGLRIRHAAQMNAANGYLAGQIGSQLAGEFNGDLASSNVEIIRSLEGNRQALVRKTYFRALRAVWVMVN
ncbi:hypothetical protein BO78DRAFT_419990 [Aspergillus sclerotiicarbonarius CBS 121057]|uniref:Uncharacterized protein n=1 Tax=Aspergillus sclerotiicarbonarius (strain CBS 121057 / IBT 28362) TaxID=1448318 RepID=A0A319E508_ASPSB|nr:hypothetical protein BO78DRAFT_419990 [Aspergillus sclerotiicarbonarius CBS 121057]